MKSVDADVPEVLVTEESFEVFYEREFHQVAALAFVLCGSWSAAEDLAQDAFVAAQRRWAVVGRYDRPEAWVRRAVANRSVSLTRRRLAEARALLRQSRERWTDPAAFDDGDGEFWDTVRSLPARQRQVISLHYVNSLSVKEIASTLDLSEATVKTHLQRGRRSLELKLTDRSKQS
ncbi:MAG: sigma-70 family RNA polymerase sigma factor [Actinobacteria bacterium]|nr:sigma-70 family RNA polymerase sigma factor [Actinomycetota bacterium]